MNKEYIDLYRDFREAARLADELELWARSYAENIVCAKTIAKEIGGLDSLPPNEEAVQSIIGEFGCDRVNWVLAATVRQGGHEGKISEDNKVWAAKSGIPSGRNETIDYRVDASPSVLNTFINQVRCEGQTLTQAQDYSEAETPQQTEAQETAEQSMTMDMRW